MVESTIQEISVCPDCPLLWLTSFSSPGEVEMRTSAPPGSFVSHEITTQPCPKEMGFGFALIFPVIASVRFLLLTERPRISFSLPQQCLTALPSPIASNAKDGRRQIKTLSFCAQRQANTKRV